MHSMQVDHFVRKLAEVGSVDRDAQVAGGNVSVHCNGLRSHEDAMDRVRKVLDEARQQGQQINDGFVLFVPIECARMPDGHHMHNLSQLSFLTGVERPMTCRLAQFPWDTGAVPAQPCSAHTFHARHNGFALITTPRLHTWGLQAIMFAVMAHA